MKILYAASEAAPFLKTGGLGDVAYGLPRALSQKEDVEICVFLPYYKAIKDNPAFSAEYVTHFDMPLAWRNTYVGIFRAVIDRVTYYLIDNEYYFYRDSIYGDYDDGERFAFFSKAILESLQHLSFYPDVIEANDWHTGLIPLYLKVFYAKIPAYSHIKTVFTIHNIEYQGKMPDTFLPRVIGVDESYRDVLSYDGCINFMKCALLLCDRISTVSETYSHEIRHAYYAHGLDPVLRKQEYKIRGILNGIDTDLYNPRTDPHLYTNYRAGQSQKKADNKKFLQEKLGLQLKADVPVVGMVSRLVAHKGLELLEYIGHRLMEIDIQLVVVGTGDSRYENLFRHLEHSYPGRVSANILFEPALASQVYAGADLFLMPSKSEPCGLSQMIAMRYGTIPIVRETGGLFDSVKPLNTETLEGQGFTFKTFNGDDLLDAIRRASDFCRDEKKHKQVMKHLMQLDLGWEQSAEKYLEMFREILP